MVSQCFDSLNIYGKEPEQLENTVLMFIHTLEEESPEEIKKAFVYWVKNNSTMPTPADILGIIESNRPSYTPAYFQTDPVEAEAYRKSRKQMRVSWAEKEWSAMNDTERNELIFLMHDDFEKGGDRWKYFKNHKKVPQNIIAPYGKAA
jgi:hypothetical protein